MNTIALRGATAPKIATYRRHGDRVMRARMLWAAGWSLALNFLVYLIIYGFTPGQGAYDKLLLILFVASGTIVFLLMLYTRKVRSLLNDIQRLAIERDKEREERSRSQKLESLGILAAGISHEINSSLQTILGSCEMAQNRLDDKAQSMLFIQRAIDNSLHARRVVSNVLTFSNASTSHSLEPLDVKQVMEECMEYSRAFLPPQVSLSLEQSKETLEANLHRAGFIQIVSNLISNASQAMNHGGTIKVESAKLTIDKAMPDAPVVPIGTYAVIRVKDTGTGIHPENMERIFDPFFTTKRIGEGTGLGLSMVHGLVKSMNGYIAVRSLVGIGSEFSVYIPLTKPQEHE